MDGRKRALADAALRRIILIPLPFERNLTGRTVLVTGHTGFTGSWLCLWLARLGVRVVGFALPPPTDPSLFIDAGVESDVESVIGDIRDYDAVLGVMSRTRPDAVIHLAAQPLVRRSYREPLETFSINAMGTANVLEATRTTDGTRAILCVTTDKVYWNDGDARPRREDDRLGGGDPYSSSKAAAEMVIDGYRHAFGGGMAIAAARGGNIVGGGDWAEDRLIPDFVRAVTGGGRLSLRYPDAVRPWQHVLALVQGYVAILNALLGDDPSPVARAWNLGPVDTRVYTVRDILEMMSCHWVRPEMEYARDMDVAECPVLTLDSGLARTILEWRPPWDTARTIRETADWYKGYYVGKMAARDLTLSQLHAWRAELTR